MRGDNIAGAGISNEEAVRRDFELFLLRGGGGADKISVFALFGEDSKIRQSDNNDKGLIIIILALYS
ncbi:MAG: hypothetical protein ACI8RD_008312 [Bacillariaceae sp.]|jgi:hypothetical protein